MANEDRLRLVNSLNQGNEDALVELQHAIAASDASNFTLAYAKRLIAEAIEQLDALPESEAAVSLRKLALASVSRKG
jgi:geranylgeranyl pyrophosphate synthase